MEDFIRYLEKEKRASRNTVDAYRRDIEGFKDYINEKSERTLDEVTKTDVIGYVMFLNDENTSKSTVARKLSSIRSFYKYEQGQGRIDNNPASDIRAPKQERKELVYLTVDEIDSLMNLTGDDEKGIRDRALMEIMYATGIRVNEAVEMRVSDVNLKMGFVKCSGKYGKARIVPIGKYAKEAVRRYLDEVRNKIACESDSDSSEDEVLFLNYMGKPLSRQGVWKILKSYGKELGIEEKITPHILRSSFAVHMLQNGADPKTVQELMGHEDMQAMQVYLSVTKTRIKDVYDRTHPRA